LKKNKIPRKRNELLPVIGWREWVSFPDLGIKDIKAKVDTGARTSALHISLPQLNRLTKRIKFLVHPKQRSSRPKILASVRVIDYRKVKSSNGETSLRPVIKTILKIGEYQHTIELTLVNRDMMGFRLLLGREAIRRVFLVDTGKSYLQSKKRKKKK